ncbi:MAG: kelch repeat-containing protein [Terracidiphilus sp.]
MTQRTRLQKSVQEYLARAGNRAASCLKAATRTLPAALALASLPMICASRAAQAQTPATSWGYMSGSVNADADDSATVPGGRQSAATWTDASGNLWLFGGFGVDSVGNLGYLNDLWEYSGGAWILKSANSTLTVPGVGLCNIGNYTSGSYAVGGRSLSATWVDMSGNLWLFGGTGCDSASSTPGDLSDLWMYNVASGNWTFEGGSQTTNQTGTYGLPYAASTTYLPGARATAVSWTGADGSFWLFGGFGEDSSGNAGPLNDLWKYDPTTLEWTWMSGGLLRAQAGDYGTLGQASATNVPGSRSFASGAVDSSGNLWLFSGSGCNTSCATQGLLNDLWMYNPTTLEWTWEAGTQSENLTGNAGTIYVTAGSNDPGSREASNLWTDSANNLWIFGGQGFDTTGAPSGNLNDLWEFDTTIKEWTFMGGSPTQAGALTPAYGTEGTPAITNIPGGREVYLAWNMNSEGDFWLFGGFGYNSPTTSGNLNDLWEAEPPTPTPDFSLIAGTYQGAQTLTISDAMSGATIYYTTNGNTPVVSSSDQYNGAVTVASTEFVQAIAVAAGHSQSLPRQANFVIGAESAITWVTPAAITYGTPLSSVQLDATTSIPGDFVYTPAAGAILPAGSNVLSVTFTPTDPVVAGFQQATATVTLQVNPATPVITWATPASIAYGTALGAAQLDATASVPGTFAYSPAAGTVLTAGAHTLNVTFTPTDTTDYTTATGSVTINVTQDTPAITWAQPAAITYGTALSATQLDATATFNGNPVPGTFVYSPASGTVLQAGTQTLDVTFTPTDTTDYATVEGSTTLVVNQAAPTITWPTPAAIAYGTALGATQLDATASSNGITVPGTFVYTPAAGTVLTAGSQLLSVTFTPTNTTDFTTATTTVTLTVNQATPTITWPTPAAIAYGTALGATQLDATASANGAAVAGTFVYSPAAGVILTAGTHTLTVTFTPTDNTDFTTATGSVTISVTEDTPTITWATPAAITYGTRLSTTQLDATASYGGNAVPGTFVYSPGAGAVLPVGTQTLTVTFTPTDTTDYTTATGSVTLVVNQATPVITWPTPASIAYGTALGSAQLDATASVPGTFVYTPVAGTMLAAGSHTLNVTFTPTDSTDYATAMASVTLVVSQDTPTIVWPTPAPITYGTALSSTQLDATAMSNGTSVAGTFTYLPAAGTVLTVGAHTLTVSFTPTDTTDYTATTGSVTINVTGNAPAITWTQPAAITYGTALGATQLDATAVYGTTAVPGTFVYSPAAGTVLPAGTQTLSVTFIPTDSADYSSATTTTTIVVNQAIPILNWQDPPAIDYGTPLSSAQLDATASIPGTFVYLPPIGTVLSVGTQTLSVIFTPADANDYTTANAGVTLTVQAPGFTLSGSPGGQTVYAGYTTDFIVTVAPANGTFNNPVALTVTGLPSGATATFSPTSVTPGSTSATSVLTVKVAANTTENQRPASPFGSGSRGLVPLMALLLLLPFRRVRRWGRKISLVLILFISLGAMLSLSACGSPGTNTIQWQDTFVLTVTGTSGTNTQSTQVVLTVQ